MEPTISERMRLDAAELVGLKPDVIWTSGGLGLLSLKRATHSIPIVFTTVYDPVGSGYVASLARPGGNITGFTLGEFSMGGKMLEVLKEVVPQVSRVAVILNLEQPPHVAMWRAVEAMAQSFGVSLTATDVQDAAEIERAIEAFAREPNGGLIVLPGPITINHREMIIALAARHRLPAAYPFRFFVTSGGLVSYGADPFDQSRQAAAYVDRILKGEKPEDLPILAADQVRVRDQPQDRQSARRDRPADVARPRRRGDRITIHLCCTAYVALWSRRRRGVMSAIWSLSGEKRT